jgi:hypothetical protein
VYSEPFLRAGGEVWLLSPLAPLAELLIAPFGTLEPFVVGHTLKYTLP